MRRKQDQQAKLLEQKADSQLQYLSGLLKYRDKTLLLRAEDEGLLRSSLEKKGVFNPSPQDLVEEKLCVLNNIYGEIIDDALKDLKNKMSGGQSFGMFKRLGNELKEKGIPKPSIVKNATMICQFNTLFNKAKKASGHSTLAVAFGIYIVIRGENLLKQAASKWSNGSSTPHTSVVVRSATAFMNTSEEVANRLVYLGGKNITSERRRSHYFAGEEQIKSNLHAL